MACRKVRRHLVVSLGVPVALTAWLGTVPHVLGVTPSPPPPAQTLWVDLNADGFPDLIRFVPGEAAQYLLNDRAGGFDPADGIPWPAPLYSAAARDLDQDGDLELLLGGEDHAYIVRLGSEGPELLHRFPTGGAIEITDFDLDGRSDLLVGDRLFRRDADGFSAVELPSLRRVDSALPPEAESADLDSEEDAGETEAFTSPSPRLRLHAPTRRRRSRASPTAPSRPNRSPTAR